jgi:membrane associated rhomboid family serine protease
MMAGRILGGGIAWLSIVSAGTLGNGLNAVMRSETHLSIGASTAVFAALGVLVAHALHPRFVSSEKLFKRWSPLIAGVLLLAFVGVGGERTDVGAHVTGFVSGMVIGWLAARLPLHWLSNPRIQMASGAAAFTVIVLAWTIAVRLGAQAATE